MSNGSKADKKIRFSVYLYQVRLSKSLERTPQCSWNSKFISKHQKKNFLQRSRMSNDCFRKKIFV